MMIRIYKILLPLCVSSWIAAQSPDELIRRGQERIYTLDFKSADAVFDSLIALDPLHPRGYFFKGSSYFYQILSGHNTRMTGDEFEKWNDKTVEVAEQYAAQAHQETEGDFYRGAAYGNSARYHAVHGEFVKAFYYAKRSKSLHEDVIEADPLYYDAYLSIGMYNYYAAAAPRWMDAIGSLFGLSGDRATGIAQLEKTYRHGKIFNLEAQFFLANVYLEEGDYETSLRIFSQLMDRFRSNPYLINQAGMVSFYLENYSVAEQIFQQSILQTSQTTRSAEMLASYFLGRMARLRGDYTKAITYFNQSVTIADQCVLFKMVDGWVAGSALYYLAETYELSGDRTKAEIWYEKARDDARSGKGIVQGAKNRLKYPIGEFEMEFIKIRQKALIQPEPSQLITLNTMLASASNKPEMAKYVSQIHYYIGRTQFALENYPEAERHFTASLDTQTDDGEEKWRTAFNRYYRGAARVKLGKKSEAKSDLKLLTDDASYVDGNRIRFRAQQLLKGL
ncbi:MAG TPA: tetratricopeptide repeat protein [bacterium]|nr:tetratricopeptide repeat protein [bacterium]HNL27405.1 tetratricopeptide repeat protein [bacterium]